MLLPSVDKDRLELSFKMVQNNFNQRDQESPKVKITPTSFIKHQQMVCNLHICFNLAFMDPTWHFKIWKIQMLAKALVKKKKR